MAAQNLKGQQTNPVFTDANLSDFTSLPALVAFSVRDFFTWWYLQMPVWYVLSLRRIATVIDDQFSISLLLRTFLVPWHRDHSFPGYLIGILVRLLYLPIAVSILLIAVGAYLAFILFWFLIPITAIVMILLSPILRFT
jgi:hypothetical protein